MSHTKPLILVDGSSYLFRAFHALPALNNARGEPTGAIKGVINMLRALLKQYPDSTVAVVFDAKGKTFRSDIYADYKANRPPMPDDLRVQIEPIHAIIKAMGLPLIVESGVEADDVIGTLAREASAAAIDTIISTGDKDMAQLVDDHVTLVNTMTNTLMDREGVIEKFGIPPELIIDFLALMGDKVDNIPGVAGVGEKTALGLLTGIGSLDEIYQRIDDVASLSIRGAKSLGKKLQANESDARLSYELATIACGLSLPFTVQELKHEAQDEAALLELYQRYEFRTWIKELSAVPSPDNVSAADVSDDDLAEEADAPSYEIVLTQADFDAWLIQLRETELFAFDTETTSLDYMDARVVGVSFAVEPGHAAYVPFGHDYIDAPTQLSEEVVLGQLKPLLEDENSAKVGHNLKYDQHVLRNHGIELAGIAYDTMLASYVLDSTGSRHDMDSLAEKYLDRTTIHFEDIAGKGKKQLTFNQIPLEQAGPYAAEDADITLRLHRRLWSSLEEIEALKTLFQQVEMPVMQVISRIEQTGVNIDPDMLFQQSSELEQQLIKLEQDAHTEAGESFNLGSPKQIQTIFFEKKGFPVIRKTPKGQPSTAEDVLEALAQDYQLPKLILEHRSLSKLKSTYTDKLPEQINTKTGRVHTSYHQAVASTGRLSSSNPNLQNIPVRTEEGRRIRQAFVAPEGYQIVAADYSQIELRIMAHLSGDESLLKAFQDGLDVHTATASEVFSVPFDQVTSDQRRSAKAINFGLIYGMSAFGLAKQLDVFRNEAQAYIDLYFSRYPGVKAYMDSTRELAKEKGYVETVYGRRLYLPEINSRNAQRRQYAERTAINAPMQGTAADIIKRAMVAVQRWLDSEQLQSRIVMQVHDELVLEVPHAELERVNEALVEQMQKAATLKVPLLVDVGVGKDWQEAH